MKLYEIPIEANDIEAQLYDSGGELTPEIEQRIASFVRGGKDKIEAAAIVVQSLQADAAICDEEAARLRARATSLEASASRLKGLVLFALDEGFGGKIKTPRFTVWGQTSGKTISFELNPDAKIYDVPVTFLRTREPELDRKALKDALDAGLEIPQVVIVDEKPGTRFLRIK